MVLEGLWGCRSAGCRALLARRLRPVVEELLALKKDVAPMLWGCGWMDLMVMMMLTMVLMSC